MSESGEVIRFLVEQYYEHPEALAYVIGVLDGDGFLSEQIKPPNKYHRLIGLEVKDLDFCQAFQQALAKLHGKVNAIHMNRHGNGRAYYRVMACDKKLYTSLRNEKVRRKVASEYSIPYLRGFIDSDASISSVSNQKGERYFRVEIGITNYALLVFIRKLIQKILNEAIPKIHTYNISSGFKKYRRGGKRHVLVLAGRKAELLMATVDTSLKRKQQKFMELKRYV